MPRTQIPGREALFKLKACLSKVRVKVSDRVALRLKTNNRTTTRAQMPPNPTQGVNLRIWRDESQNVARQYSGIKWLHLAVGLEIKFNQVRHHPRHIRMVLTGGRNQNGIHINSHDVMTSLMQDGTDSTRPATGIEYP